MKIFKTRPGTAIDENQIARRHEAKLHIIYWRNLTNVRKDENQIATRVAVSLWQMGYVA